MLLVGGADLGSLRFGQDEHRQSMAMCVVDDKTLASHSLVAAAAGRALPTSVDRPAGRLLHRNRVRSPMARLDV